MNFLRKFCFILTAMALCSLPAWAQVIVNSPASGAVVASQFTLSAYDTTCSGQPVSAMGFSLDSSSNNTFVYSTSIYSSVTAPAGAHTLHVKAWGNAGSGCDTDVAINVDGVSVSSPGNDAPISSTFALVASSVTCSLQPVTAMGYSFDNGATAFVYANSMNGSVTAPSGAQTMHVKSWGNQGAGCDTDVALNIEGSAAPAAVGGVSVSEPAQGSTVSSPFGLDASSTSCSSQSISAMGYSLDNSSSTAFVYSTSVSASVTAAAGAHVLHIKSWGNQGAACDTDVDITVSASGSASGGSSNVASSGGSGPYVPSNAVSVSNIQALGDWISIYDPGTAGAATGAMAMTGSPSITGNALEFYTTYSYYGGELYYATFGDDTTSTNFVYDGWVYLNNSSGSIANLEMDMNQVVNGYTVIFGFQCDGWSGTWDYTENAGTPNAPIDHWVHSSAACNPQSWAQNVWHHVQVSYSRDAYGDVTYQSVWIDGNQQTINATVNSAFALGWGPTLLTNFQVDSIDPGWSSSSVYLDNLTISRW